MNLLGSIFIIALVLMVVFTIRKLYLIAVNAKNTPAGYKYVMTKDNEGNIVEKVVEDD